MRFLTQLMKLPMAALAYSVEMFVKTIQGLQKIADQSVDLVVSGTSQLFSSPDAPTDFTVTATRRRDSSCRNPRRFKK